MKKTIRKSIIIPEDYYKSLVRAQVQIKRETGIDMALGQCIAYLANKYLASFPPIVDFLRDEETDSK